MVLQDLTTVMMATGLKAVNSKDQKQRWNVQIHAQTTVLLLIRTLLYLMASAIITATDTLQLVLIREQIPGLKHTLNVEVAMNEGTVSNYLIFNYPKFVSTDYLFSILYCRQT